MNYQEFIEQKKHSVIDFGIKANFIPDKMFDFQKYVTEYLCKKPGKYFSKTMQLF